MSISRQRLGTSLEINVEILTAGEATSLEGRDITVMLRDPSGTKSEITDYTIGGEDDNVITFTFEGMDQTLTGIYAVEVYENYQQEDMATLDMDAFMLVGRSRLVSDDNDLATAVINLSAGNLTITGPRGLSAYEVAVKNGYEGTETEWLESLKAYDFDTTPTEDSTNPVTSGGVYTMITEAVDGLVSEGSTTYNNF